MVYGSLFSSEFIKIVPISRNCFSAILTFLHISDIDPTTSDYSDGLQKVRNLLDHLNSKCQDHFYPHKNVSVDERMVKARVDSRASNIHGTSQQNGGSNFGFVLILLMEYTWHFQVYRGKQGESLSSNGLSYDVVMKIVSGLEKQGYIVYMDNFYSPPTLFKELRDLVPKGLKTLLVRAVHLF